MDCVMAPIGTYLVTPLYDMISKHCGYMTGLQYNLILLTEAKHELEYISQDVQMRVDLAEQYASRRTHQVKGWLEMVEVILKKVDDILRKGDEQIQKTSLSKFCFPRNWCSRDRLGKLAGEMIIAVNELASRGHFDDVTEQLPRALVVEMPIGKTVGLDSIINEVWTCINGEDKHSETVIGLFGMGGVGKTTLLMKLNNKFLDSNHNFDLVIWVKVSKNSNLQTIQEVVLKRLQIPEVLWRGKDEDGRAAEILKNIRGKRFVLLLDDVWERLDLSKLGVSLDDNQTGFKIIFSTRSEEVCGEMGAHRRFRVECLSPEAALDLFRYKVGEDVFNSNSEIPSLAQVAVEECQGLPLALVTIGHAMASRMGPKQWRFAISELQRYPFRFAGMGNSVFPILRFSYDSLREGILKTCFLYCSLFPEEQNIRKDELVQLWIGEGFLNAESPRDQGEYVIESLKLACLLERGENSEDSVKMHSLIRDMALQLASENNMKTLVQNHVGSIQSNNFDGWNETVRMSLWGSSIDYSSLVEAPPCPKVRTLLIRLTMLPKLPIPSKFFGSMVNLEVLDLSYNLDLNELPGEISRLVNLSHLDLSNTSIGLLPIEIKCLINLKILLLDGIQCQLNIPGGVISSLPLLQVFSCFSTELVELIDPLSNETAILNELEGLKHVNDLSLTLFSVQAVDKFLNSSKLQRCIRRLTIVSPELHSLNLGLMLSHLETLHIKCGFMERLQYDQRLNRPSFSTLRHLSIVLCPEIKDLTFLIHIPSLQFLSLSDCYSLKEIIGTDAAGSSGICNYFSNLMVADFDSLTSLERICSGTLPFPSLQAITVTNCPSLKKLPFNSEIAKRSLISIRGSAKWWNLLEWENEATKQVFAAKFQEMKEKQKQC